MTSRCSFAVCMAVLLVGVLAMVGTPKTLQAQEKCLCDHYTFIVDRDVTCKITVCWQFSEKGPQFCQTIGAGGELSVPCPVFSAGIQTCTGYYAIIDNSPAISICTPGLSIPGGCCVRGCRTTDAKGCPAIRISNADCPGPICL